MRRLAAVLAILLAAPPARGAEPRTGTLSDVETRLEFRGGPFVVARPSGAPKAPVCAASVCDDFLLNLAFSGDRLAAHPGEVIAVSVAWPAAADDFDLYILEPNGQELARAATRANPEVARIPARAGRGAVILRVVPFRALAARFTATVALEPAPPPTPDAAWAALPIGRVPGVP